MSILAVLLCLANAPSRAPLAPSEDPAAHPAVLERILVIGASLSHGYGLAQEGGASVRFADVVEASLRVEHEPVRPRTSLFFFVDPLPTGQSIVDAGKAADPTLVIGLDYLFWFGYGVFATEGDRMAMLDNGLSQLETFDCALIVGDLPDVRVASRDPARGGEGWLLLPQQVPEPATLRKLNDRLRRWAGSRKNVVIVPLEELVGRMHAGREVEIRGNRWSGEELGNLVQRDRLHPTLDGAIALWIGALDALVAAQPEVPESSFEWNAQAIRKRIPAAGAKARQREVGVR